MKSLVTCLLITISIIAVSQDNMVIDQKTGKISYDKIGNVKFLKGKVFRTKKMEKASEEIGVNFPILEKDIIQTGEKSVIKIIMNDATIITLGENSHFNFKNYKMKSKSERVATYDLKSGNARIDVPVKISKGKLNFNTRTVSLGVRGTKFLMKQEVETNGDLKEQIALLEKQLKLNLAKGAEFLTDEQVALYTNALADLAVARANNEENIFTQFARVNAEKTQQEKRNRTTPTQDAIDAENEILEGVHAFLDEQAAKAGLEIQAVVPGRNAPNQVGSIVVTGGNQQNNIDARDQSKNQKVQTPSNIAGMELSNGERLGA